MIETQSIILKIYVIKFRMNLKYRSSHRWCSLNKIFIKTLQYSQENICVMESLFNKVTGLQACNFTKKRLQHRRFPVNIANFKNNYFEKHLWTAASASGYILHRKLNKIIEEPDGHFVSFET